MALSLFQNETLQWNIHVSQESHNNVNNVNNSALVPELLSVGLNLHLYHVDPTTGASGMRLLFQKKLSSCDNARTMLPPLPSPKGITLRMRDLRLGGYWDFRYNFWPRNGRNTTYLLSNTWDFVKLHKLKAGDFIKVYKDDHNNKFMIEGAKM